MTNRAKWEELPSALRERAEPARKAVREGKSVLLIGPPGAGKTMVARRLCAALPPRGSRKDERPNSFLVDKIRMLAGLPPLGGLERPFRAPHHTVSRTGMLGRGTSLQPGELSLASGGVLFLDEIAEFSSVVLETVGIAQRDRKVTFPYPSPSPLAWLPADFVLVAATNPCPCGCGKGHKTRQCECTEDMIARYHARYARLKFDLRLELSLAL